MLEYFGYKQYKKYKTEKEAKEAAEREKSESGGTIPQQQQQQQQQQPHPNSRPSLSQRQPSSRPISPAGSAATDRTSDGVGGPKPVLDRRDEDFFRRILSDADGEDSDDEHLRPPLPPRSKTPEYLWESDESRRTAPADDVAVKHGSNPKKAATVAVPDAAAKKPNKIAFLFSKVKGGDDKDKQLALTKPAAVTPEEAARERDDLSRVLDDLNLSARNNKAIPLSAESSELVRQFTLALKDLVNGVPTAVDDIKNLVEDRDGTLKKSFDKLPNSMKKLVTNLPDKFTATLGPEVLAAAAQSRGMKAADVTVEDGVKGAAKKMFTPTSIADLVTKPGAIVGMLKAIVNALKLRWPAFIGTNVIVSVALFLLLFVLWYCHKRGREERLKRENAPEIVDGGDRIEELPDDPALPAPSSSGSGSRTDADRSERTRSRRSGRGCEDAVR